MTTTQLKGTPAVYVGTYRKYNNGDISGAWLYLANYATYADFLAACGRVHKDEKSPEFMIQDSECFPDGLDCMEWMSEEEFNDVKTAMSEQAQEQDAERPSLQILDYSERAFAVVGDTKPVKDALKRMGGRFNGRLSCGAGWIFPNKAREAVTQFIANGTTTESKQERTPDEGAQFKAWLKEYAAQGVDDYGVKNAVGAVKIDGHYWLIDKPSIENRFCFHDEGPQYDQYKSLTSDDSKMRQYFKAENLSKFDEKIERIEQGDKYSHDKRVWRKNTDYCHQLRLRFYTHSWDSQDEGEILCTDEEKQLILKALQYGRKCFENRLDAYLKRYGTSKIHTWSYWADA